MDPLSNGDVEAGALSNGDRRTPRGEEEEGEIIVCNTQETDSALRKAVEQHNRIQDEDNDRFV